MQKTNIKIAPSILSANFAKLGEEVKNISESGADLIHIDVMDGNFVPNITFGPKIINDIRNHSNTPFDVHLMISNPDLYIEDFAKSADIITFHLEASTHVIRTLELIKSFNKKAGISIVPSTSPDALDYTLDHIDLILVMSVNPGFGGQKFITSQLKKIEIIKNKISKQNKSIEVSVDGGISNLNSNDVINAGADILVAGNYIFKDGAEFYKDRINSLRGLL